jgi:glycosyltransferase involved in cell wall biosynthesis
MSPTAAPLVSVIMPVYNGVTFISQAIESVLAQTYTHWELLIVDDGSKDGSDTVAKGYTDPRIHFFSVSHGGVSSARNSALARLKGEFICLLDCDDMLPPNSLQSRLLEFSKSPDISFVDGTVLVHDHDMKKVHRIWRPAFTGKPWPMLVRLSDKCFFGPSWMIRRDNSREYKFEGGLTHAEDLLFYISIADQGNYAYTNDTVLLYRKNAGSASSNLDGLARGYRTVFNRLKPRLSLPQRMYLSFRVRQIMFLSYLSKGCTGKALKFASLRKL